MINDDNINPDDEPDMMEDDFDFGDDSFDEFGDEKKDKTLGDMWRENPMVKIGVIAGAFVLLVIVFLALSGKKEEPAPSVIGAGSEINAPPGTDEVSPVYADAVEEENEKRIEEAVREGRSALPTPVEPPIGRLTVPAEEEEQEDPLQRWRRLQQERLEREMKQASVVETAPQEPAVNPEMIEAMSEAMSTQMQAILEAHNQPTTISSMGITDVQYLEELAKAEEEKNAEDENADETVEGTILLNAAEIEYAQLINEANSDVPGPVIAQIVSGPLAGGRLLGDFAVEDVYLTLNFSTLVLKGKTYSVSAIALDPDTTLPGMATEVNYRIFKRVLLPMAAAFVEGAAEAISESGRTTVTLENGSTVEETSDTNDEQEIASGIDEAGQELRDILEDMAGDTEILVRIEAGTPMAILFLDDVVEEPEDDNLRLAPNLTARSTSAGIDR